MHEGAIAKQYQALLLDLGFTGLVMIEVRGTPTAAKMIEANPRFWGPAQLFVDADVNFFAAFLQDHGFDISVTSVPASNEPTKYFWDDGVSFNDDCIADTSFHNYSASQLMEKYKSWDRHNLFKKPDTMEVYSEFTRNSDVARASKLKQLIEQYSATSKHSNYQILAPQLETLIPQDDLETRSRHEKERFSAIRDSIDLDGKTVLDIGGNTGYFTFEALRSGASVTYFEGNQSHADFVATAGEILNVQHRLNVRDQYYLFDGTNQGNFDVVFLLNVLHHVGDDYGDTKISIEKARQSIIDSLLGMTGIAQTLVFQLGFNWKGDIGQPLFEGGTKREMIDFLQEQLSDAYSFDQILVADAIDGRIVYEDVNDDNVQRRDELGEFLNRPLMILTPRT
jgi:2-polyprenyl-3-methyl-5-hydroxy-6-metoxy-1,4-benzoquinol methylase